MQLRSVRDIPWHQLTSGLRFRPSPNSWEDQVLYFFLIDRFSDDTEDGYLDNAGNQVTGKTPMGSRTSSDT